jgi:plasmid maintenance system antidote protein VapI
MATLCSLERERYEAIEAGKGKITQTTACKLQQGTGIPAKFWLKFEERFRADLKAGKKWTA